MIASDADHDDYLSEGASEAHIIKSDKISVLLSETKINFGLSDTRGSEFVFSCLIANNYVN